MPRKLVSKTSFLGGEAGLLLEGRSDLAQHQLGASKLQNFLVTKGGAITRRPGTQFAVNLGSSYCRIIDFVTSYDSADEIYAVFLSLVTSTRIGVFVMKTSDYTFPLAVGDAYIDTDMTVTETDLNEIQYTQIGATLFLVHKSFSPHIVRTAPGPAFTIDNYVGYGNAATAQQNTLPYRDPNISGITLAVNTASIGIGRVLTASSAFFDAGHVGAFFRVYSGGSWGACYVTHFTDSTHVDVTVVQAFGATTATTEWQESSWSKYRGWPRTITLYNQRAIFGGNASEPDTFWASNTDNYFWMSIQGDTTVTADTPQSFTLASAKLNQIRWMVGGKKLTIGTSSSEWVGLFYESSDGTSTQVQFNEETTHGSSPVQARRSGVGIPFVQRSKKSLREIVFDFYSDTYVATDMTLFGSHVGEAYGDYDGTDPSIIQIAYQESPINIIWVLDSLGRLFGLTRDKEQQIAAWHSHEVAGVTSNRTLFGVLATGTFPAQIVSMCVLPSPGGTVDRLWLVVRRSINGADQYHVEYIDDVQQSHQVVVENYANIKNFLDCAKFYTHGSNTTSWTGATHLAGETAYAISVDNAIPNRIVHCGPVTVDGSGNFTTSHPGRLTVLGLLSQAEVRLLPVEGGDNPPFYMRAKKRVDLVALRLHQTLGLRIGKNRTLRNGGWEENDTDFEPIPFDMSQPLLPTFTGIKEVSVPADVDYDGTFALVMQEPWPCTILSICSRVVENEV